MEDVARGDGHGRGGCRDSASCVWVARYRQAQDELTLLRYEARKWKEKYMREKLRRRTVARSLLEVMVTIPGAHGHELGHMGAAANENGGDTRRSSSAFSDRNHIDSLLSPTLSSFDFDDDDEEDEAEDENEDEDKAVEEDTGVLSGGVNGVQSKVLSEDTPNSAVNGGLSDNNKRMDSTHIQKARANKTPGRVPRTSSMVVRTKRSSTVGMYDVLHGGDARRAGNATYTPMMPSSSSGPSPLLYRMLYTKPSSSHLWSMAPHAPMLKNVARSLMFSMHLKREHVFENFFVVGLTLGHKELDHATHLRHGTRIAADDGGLVGFWKPRVMLEYPQKPNRPQDESVADFCFPAGVPVVKCKPHQAAALTGTPVSVWSTDPDSLREHTLDPFRTSGYTFRLTGAKGEARYGFCVAVMSELVPYSDRPTVASDANGAAAHAHRRAKHESYRNSSMLRYPSSLSSDGEEDSRSHTSPHHEGISDEESTGAESSYLAPVCYCFTSKFPFYRLQFSMLRMLIENEIRVKQRAQSGDDYSANNSNQYDVALQAGETLGVGFAVCSQPNESVTSLLPHDTSIPAMSSISSAIHVNMNGADSTFSTAVCTLSEEAPGIGGGTLDHRFSTTSNGLGSPTLLKKSLSADDVMAYTTTTTSSCIVEKPVVVRVTASPQDTTAKSASLVHVGDVLEAIDGVSTASLSYEEALDLLANAPRPLKLRFQRLDNRSHVVLPNSPAQKTLEYLSPSSVDILQRLRCLKIGDPGQWSTLRLPHVALNYQFPKRRAERWAVGVALKYVSPRSLVQILTHLLLEKQVAVMGASCALVSAICTALQVLLSPYQWQSTYIPQLPLSLLDFLHSPVPFLAGCQSLESTAEWPDVCFFDLDNDIVTIPIADHHVNASYLPYGDELRQLFQGARERYQKLRPVSKPWHELSEEEDNIITLTMQESERYLRDICSEMTAMELAPIDDKTFYEQMQDQVSRIVRQSPHVDFLEEFSQTQLFCEYCESALRPEESPPR